MPKRKRRIFPVARGRKRRAGPKLKTFAPIKRRKAPRLRTSVPVRRKGLRPRRRGVPKGPLTPPTPPHFQTGQFIPPTPKERALAGGVGPSLSRKRRTTPTRPGIRRRRLPIRRRKRVIRRRRRR